MILVHIETDLDGTASEVSLEAITFARNLSAEGGGVPVDAVVFNDLSEELHKELGAYGVRTVHRAPGAPCDSDSRGAAGLSGGESR